MRARFWIAVLLSAVPLLAQRYADFKTPVPLPAGSTLVVGFLGGFEHWNDPHRGVRKLVLRLKTQPNAYAESIANSRRAVALKLIRRALDTNHDGMLDPKECASARVILFGQSLGAAAAIATARDLERLGVPVLLTVQVDSVGMRDRVVPANVRAAVNFYQHDLLTFQGARQIRAADPSRTRILGNFQASYSFGRVESKDASWARRTFGGSHAKMELDPQTWKRVDEFIQEAIARR